MIILYLWLITIVLIPVIRAVWWFFFAEKRATFHPNGFNTVEFALVVVFWPVFLFLFVLVFIFELVSNLENIIIKLRNRRFKG